MGRKESNQTKLWKGEGTKQVALWATSAESQHNVWRHHNLQCSKAGNYELETAIGPTFKHKILCQFCLSARLLKRSELKWQRKPGETIYYRPSRAAYFIVSCGIR